MYLTDKLLWLIEAHLRKPLSLGQLAALGGVSKFHMIRSFRLSTGMAPMTYLRARRLSLAAQLLAAGEQDILGLALELQYQSHAAFTRAFSAYFGISPGSIRRSRTLETLKLMEPLKMNQDMLIDLDPPRIQDLAAFQVVGLGVNASVDDTRPIPQLWQDLNAVFAHHGLDPQIDTFGVCLDTDDQGHFRYIAGLKPATNFKRPPGFETVDIPANTYAVFTHRGHIADIGKSTYTLWNKGLSDAHLTAKFAPSFERYDHRFDPTTGRGLVEIWVPIET